MNTSTSFSRNVSLQAKSARLAFSNKDFFRIIKFLRIKLREDEAEKLTSYERNESLRNYTDDFEIRSLLSQQIEIAHKLFPPTYLRFPKNFPEKISADLINHRKLTSAR